MTILDGQLHANQIGPHWQTADLETTLDATVVAMDAVGVHGAVLDEFTGLDDDYHMLPGSYHANGAWRPERPFSELAAATYPDRFVWLTRVDPHDPELGRLVAAVRAKPGCAGIRVHAGFDGGVWRDPSFLDGGYDDLFAACQTHQVPVFIMITPRLDTLEPYLRRFPELPFIVDHIGISWPGVDASPTERYARLEPVRALSQYGNAYLKWSHVERLAADPYPYPDLMPHFRRVVDDFGPERILWASDHTQAVKPGLSPHPAPYSHSLHYLRDSDAFSAAEKEWLLGRTVATVLNWQN